MSQLAKQLNKIKYDLVGERSDRDNTEDFDEEEYSKLFLFMRKTVKELLGDPPEAQGRPLTVLLEPTLRIKTLRFIKENCPNYTKRLKK